MIIQMIELGGDEFLWREKLSKELKYEAVICAGLYTCILNVSLKVSTCFCSQPIVSPRGFFMFALGS